MPADKYQLAASSQSLAPKKERKSLAQRIISKLPELDLRQMNPLQILILIVIIMAIIGGAIGIAYGVNRSNVSESLAGGDGQSAPGTTSTRANPTNLPSPNSNSNQTQSNLNCPAGSVNVSGIIISRNVFQNSTENALQVIVPQVLPILTGNFTKDYLDSHNKFRSILGLPLMTRSLQLEQFAQNYSNYLALTRSFLHSTSNYGENLYMTSSSQGSAFGAVKAWFEEYPNFRSGRIINTTVWNAGLQPGKA